MATGGHSQPDFPVKTRQKASSSPFREFSPGARPLSHTDDSLFGNANGRGRSQTMGPSISSPQQFLRSKSLRNSREKSKKVSDSGLNLDRPNSGPSELIHHPDDSEGMGNVRRVLVVTVLLATVSLVGFVVQLFQFLRLAY